MRGIPIFVIGQYSIQPAQPEKWSFSSLKGFDECPRRWALARTTIPCFGGLVPQKPNRTSVEGILLHSLIERFALESKRDGADMFRPRRILLETISEWASDNVNNARIDSKALAGQVRIEEILRAFADLRSYVTQVSKPTGGSPPFGDTRYSPQGAEVWLRDPKSKLSGRADSISSGEIVDFKSGEKQDQHDEQLAFYAALYLAATGKPPAALRLVYTATNEVRQLPVPSLEKLELSLAEMRQRAGATDEQVSRGEFPAKPDLVRCQYCHVRALCGSYWKMLDDTAQSNGGDESSMADYRPTATARIETAALGRYIRDSWFGSPSVVHIQNEVAKKIGNDARRLRILALRATINAGSVRFAFTQNTEIYVL